MALAPTCAGPRREQAAATFSSSQAPPPAGLLRWPPSVSPQQCVGNRSVDARFHAGMLRFPSAQKAVAARSAGRSLVRANARMGAQMGQSAATAMTTAVTTAMTMAMVTTWARCSRRPRVAVEAYRHRLRQTPASAAGRSTRATVGLWRHTTRTVARTPRPWQTRAIPRAETRLRMMVPPTAAATAEAMAAGAPRTGSSLVSTSVAAAAAVVVVAVDAKVVALLRAPRVFGGDGTRTPRASTRVASRS